MIVRRGESDVHGKVPWVVDSAPHTIVSRRGWGFEEGLDPGFKVPEKMMQSPAEQGTSCTNSACSSSRFIDFGLGNFDLCEPTTTKFRAA